MQSYSKDMNTIAREIEKKENQNNRDGEPDPYVIIILTQL